MPDLFSEDLECSFCTRTLCPTPTVLEALAIAATTFTIGNLDVDGWRMFLTGSGEPTVICDRCLPVYATSAALIGAAVDGVTRRIRSAS